MIFQKFFATLILVNLFVFSCLEKSNCQNRYFHYRFENLKPTDPGLFAGEYKMESTPDGGFVIANRDWATDNILAVKLDSCGEVAWARRLAGMPPFTTCSGMISDTAGNVAMIFQRYDLNGDDYVFAVKLDAQGKILWQKRMAFASSFGFADFHLTSDGRYCFGSIFFDGLLNDLHIILLDAQTGATSAAYRFSHQGGAGNPYFANLPNGNLLVRTLGEWFSFNLNTEKVDWSVRFNDPATGWHRSKPLVFGEKLVYPTLAGPLSTTGKILLRFFDLQGNFLFSGDKFEGNQAITNLSGVHVLRRLTALPGKRFALATTQKTPEMQIALLVFDSLGRQVSTQHFHPKTNVFRKAHDQILLADGSMAVLGESDGRMEVLKISPEKTIGFCVGDTVSLPTSTLQTGIVVLPPSNYQIKNEQFSSIDLNLTEHDFELQVEKICDFTQVFPDRDTTFQICPNDSVQGSAAAGLAATCIWDDGFEGCERVLRPSDGPKTAVVRVRCTSFSHRFLVEEKTDCPCQIHFPNAFTPNGDGVNDLFRPVSDCRFFTFDFEIFDRWGQSVFTSTNFDTGWDGNISGQAAPSDVYFFALKYQTAALGSSEKLTTGDVTLLR